MIELDSVTKSYSGGPALVDVLRGVSARIAAGEFVAIVGPSGCGKTTLLNILGYLERPDAGSYRLDGTDLSLADDDALSAVRNQRIGFVFQHFHLLDRASALRNVMLPLLYAEGEIPDGEQRAMNALVAVGLEARARHRPSELSGGEQQRVAIARALINDPMLVLADEPTGNLDAKTGAEILDILGRLRSRGRTIVLVTHDAAVADRAERVLALEGGRLVAARAMA